MKDRLQARDESCLATQNLQATRKLCMCEVKATYDPCQCCKINKDTRKF